MPSPSAGEEHGVVDPALENLTHRALRHEMEEEFVVVHWKILCGHEMCAIGKPTVQI